MLRTAGADVYDQWVNHEIPFNDPQVLAALETVGGILKNPDYVNGGLGDVQSIATVAMERGRPTRSPTSSASCTVRPTSTRPTGTRA